METGGWEFPGLTAGQFLQGRAMAGAGLPRQGQRDLAIPAADDERQRRPRLRPFHDGVELLHVLHRLPVDGDDDIAQLEPRPLRRFEIELSRPYFRLEPGSVETAACRPNDRLALVHRLISNIPGEKVYGRIVEVF